MTKSRNIRGPRPTYSEGFKIGAVELYKKHRLDHPDSTHYGASLAASKRMGVTHVTISNWVARADATTVAQEIEPAPATPIGLLAPLTSPQELAEEKPEPSGPDEGSFSTTDPQAVILGLRRELAAARSANAILISATAYLAGEALKAA